MNPKRIVPVIVLVIIAIVLIVRENAMHLSKVMISGKTMGTTYNITYLADGGINYKNEIDSPAEGMEHVVVDLYPWFGNLLFQHP